jgi:hypothetical protein
MRINRLVCMVMAAAMLSAAAISQAADRKEGDKGTFTGVVSEKGANWFRAKNEGGGNERFMPNWIGGMPADGGGLDKTISEKIKNLNVGDKVEVEWAQIEHLRAMEIKVLEAAKTEKKE